MTTITLRMDDDTKARLDNFCNDTGLSITTFYMIYTNKVLRDGKIPFEIGTGTSKTEVSTEKEIDELLSALGKINIDEAAVAKLREESII